MQSVGFFSRRHATQTPVKCGVASARQPAGYDSCTCNGLIRRHKASGMSLNFVPVLPEKFSRGYQIRVGPKVMLPTKALGPSYDSALPLSQLIPLFGETDAASLHILSSRLRRNVLRCVTIALLLPNARCLHTRTQCNASRSDDDATEDMKAGGGVIIESAQVSFPYSSDTDQICCSRACHRQTTRRPSP